jgi:hypothetical protein
MSKSNRTFEELMTSPAPKSWINEPIDYAVDFEIEPMSARQRADKRWGMEGKEPEQCN